MNKQAIRTKFRNDVFARDKYCCICCNKPGKDRQGGDGWKKFHREEFSLVPLDAHHIISRKEMPNGGYVKENGISVCDECHIKAEAYWSKQPVQNGFMPDELFKKIGSSEELARSVSELVPE